MSKQKYSDNSISGLTVDWGQDLADIQQRPFSGAEVQKFIKNQLSGLSESVASRVGYVAIEIDADNLEGQDNYLYCFASEEDYGIWNNSGEDRKKSSPLILTYAKIPDGNALLDSYSFDFHEKNEKTVTTTNTAFTAYVCAFVQKQPKGGTLQVLDEAGTLTIIYSGGRKSMSLRSAASADDYTPINLSPYLVANTTNEIKLTWKGDESQRLQTLTYSITLSSYGLALATDFSKPFDPTATGLTVSFSTSGTIKKMVYLLMTENTAGYNFGTPFVDESNIGEQSYHMKAVVNGVGFANFIFPNTTFTTKLPKGLYKAQAWLCAYNADGTNYEAQTEPMDVQWLVSDQNSGLEFVINNINTNVSNWAQNTLFDYSFVGATSSSFKFIFWSADGTKQYSNPVYVNDASPATKYTLTTQTELDIEDPGETTNVLVKVYQADTDVTSGTTALNTVAMTVDTSEDFSPTKVDAGFIMNPKSRSNGSDQAVIYNEAATTGSKEISATWTNMDWLNGGWTEDDDSNKCLRILAGSKVSIPYADAWLDNAALTNGCTIEFDFAFRNVANSEEAVVRMCQEETEHYDSNAIGFIMYPNVSYFGTTENTSGNTLDRDVEYRENTRTHLTINIKPNHTVTYTKQDGTAGSATGNVIRIYVNGTINREFLYTKSARLRTISNLIIGSNSCDVDIYSIRLHKNYTLESFAIRKDYEYALPSIDEKKTHREANDICYNSTSDEISYAKAKLKYNTLLFEGTYPCWLNQADSKGDLTVTRMTTNAAGNLVIDTDNSCKITKMKLKGQGSTAKTYYKWNGSWSFTDDSVYYSLDAQGEQSEAIADHGYYELVERDENDQIVAITPQATKLVGKLNYASSMQSHKEGSLEMYEALRSQLNIKSEIQNTTKGKLARTAVLEEPYLLFIKETDTSTPQFYGLMTWGAAKGDKNTFGCKVDSTNTVWVGGSAQANELTLMFAPWLDDGTVTYNKEEEGWLYNGSLAYDYEMGSLGPNEDGSTTGSTAGPIKYIRDYQNFIFQHSYRLKPYGGSAMPTSGVYCSGGTVESSYQYWLTEGTNKYKVYRFDYPNKKWVNAGVTTDANGKAVACEMDITNFLSGITVEYGETSYTIGTDNISTLDVNIQNTLFKRARAKKLRAEIGNYTNITDTLNCFCYTLFIEASDNLAKNSYFLVDKVADGATRPMIRPWRDDDDTIFRINNLGQKDKPYWTELHTPHPSLTMDNVEENVYFTASRSGYYGTLYYAYHEDLKDRNDSSTPSILTSTNSLIGAMATLGQNTILEDDGIEIGNVMGCFNRYFFKVQKYFPSVAYNETARLLYEEAALRSLTEKVCDDYNSAPITMSMGDSLQGEIQFLKMRIFYMKTFAMYYQGLRSIGEQINTNNPTVTVTAAAHMYAFAMRNEDQKMVNFPTLLEPGESTVLDLYSSNGAVSRVVGTEYLSSLGDWHGLKFYDSSSRKINLKSYRITNFVAGNDVESVVKNNYTSLEEGGLPEVVETFNMQNVSTFGGTVDLSAYKRLKDVKLDGTSVTTLILPQSSTLSSCTLSNNLQQITINKVPNLDVSSFALESRSSLESITIVCHGGALDYYGTTNFTTTSNQWLFTWWNTMKTIHGEYVGDYAYIKMDGVKWKMNAAQCVQLADIKKTLKSSFAITGTITVTDAFSQTQVNAILDAFGDDAFSQTAALMFEATVATAFLTVPAHIQEEQTGQAKVVAFGLSGMSTTWALEVVDTKMWISGQTATGCTICVGDLNDNVHRTLSATTTGINIKTLETYTTTLTAEVTGSKFTYPSSGNSAIGGSFQLTDVGSNYTFPLNCSTAVTAVYKEDETTEHGGYRLIWSKVEPRLEAGDYEEPVVNIQGTLNPDGSIDCQNLVLRVARIDAGQTFPVDITCQVYYTGQVRATIVRRVFVGEQLLDTFGYLYCSDGNFYPTVDDVPAGITPVGVVVVPARHTLGLSKNAGTNRVMSLVEMNTSTPETGKLGYQGIYWGGYTQTTPSKKYTQTANATGGTTDGYSRMGSETNYNGNYRYYNDGSTTDSAGNPKTQYEGFPVDYLYYYSTTTSGLSDGITRVHACPFGGTPTDWANGYMPRDYTPSGTTGYGRINTATSDMDGQGNTTVILDQVFLDDEGDVSGFTNDWRLRNSDTDSGIVVSSTPGYFPAAECCRRFHVTMDHETLAGGRAVRTTKDYDGYDSKGVHHDKGALDDDNNYITVYNGDWYLPSAGELGYIIPRFARLNTILNAVRAKWANAYPLYSGSYYWSSSEYSSNYAWRVDTYYGYVYYGDYYKYYDFYVRAFLAV